jgi:poly-gamma-glutamate synthesis protein (capsule biosynthesis protein)
MKILADTVKIACVGDIMCGDSFYAIGHGVASVMERLKEDFVCSEIVDLLCSYELVLGNVECVLSDVGRDDHKLRSIQMRGRPECAKYLASWGITVAHVANNHILEHGYDAARDTVRRLRNAGIQTAGSGRDGTFEHGAGIAEIGCSGHSINVIGVCISEDKYAFNGGINLDETIETIRSLYINDKVVIVSVHWGDEFMDRPSFEQRQIAQEFINAGAALVIGHHPHVVQGIEYRDQKLVAYSMGHFIFNSLIEDTTWSIILSLTISGRDVVQWEYIPIIINKEHRPVVATGDRKRMLVKEVNRRCDLLKTDMSTKAYKDKYRSDLKNLKNSVKRRLRLELLTGMLRVNPAFWPQFLYRPIQRRMGIW